MILNPELCQREVWFNVLSRTEIFPPSFVCELKILQMNFILKCELCFFHAILFFSSSFFSHLINLLHYSSAVGEYRSGDFFDHLKMTSFSSWINFQSRRRRIMVHTNLRHLRSTTMRMYDCGFKKVWIDPAKVKELRTVKTR